MQKKSSQKKDLFIEKPVTLSSKHILDLSKISKKQKTILMSGYIYSYNIYLKYIKENILSKNKLGKIKYIFFERSNFGPIRNDSSCIWDLAAIGNNVLIGSNSTILPVEIEENVTIGAGSVVTKNCKKK